MLSSMKKLFENPMWKILFIISSLKICESPSPTLFNCNNDAIKIHVPNATLTPYFFKELYSVDFNDIINFICICSAFSSITPEVFSSLKNLNSINISKNRIKSLNLPYPNLSYLNLSDNLLNPKSSISSENIEIENLDISNNYLTSSSDLLKSNTYIKKDLNISNNLLTSIDLPSFFPINKNVYSNLDISNNLISILDLHTISLIKSSKNIKFCPQMRNVTCKEKGVPINSEIDKLLNLAGKFDFSCFSNRLPDCGEIKVYFSDTNKKSINVIIDFPDPKEVYLGEELKLMFSSSYFEPIIFNMKNSVLVNNKFGGTINLTKNIKRGEILEISVEEIKDEKFMNPLTPRIAYFLLRNNEQFNVQEMNEYIRQKFKDNKYELGYNKGYSEKDGGNIENLEDNMLSGTYYFWGFVGCCLVFGLFFGYFKIIDAIARKRNERRLIFEELGIKGKIK